MVAVCLVTTAGIKKLFDEKHPTLPQADAKEVFKKLYSKFTDFNTSLNLSGTVTLTEEDVVKEKTSFHLVRHGHQVYHRFDVMQQISNDKITVQLDTLNKYLVIAKTDRQWLKQQKAGVLPFAAMLNDTASFKMRLIQDDGKQALEIINMLQPEIKSCKLVYDPVSYTLQQTVVQWWKQSGLFDAGYWETTIEYQYNTQQPLDVEEMLNKIVTVDKKNIEINPAYAGYQVEIAENLRD